jgi:uncharacterized membrane protein HdeD (DUF308 family)
MKRQMGMKRILPILVHVDVSPSRRSIVTIVFVRSWRALPVRGAVSMLFGAFAVLWPAIRLTALVLLFGMSSLADGVLALIVATRPGERTRAPLLVVDKTLSLPCGRRCVQGTLHSRFH